MAAARPGTVRAAKLCARCGHASVRHYTGTHPGCSFVTAPPAIPGLGMTPTTVRCACTGYTSKRG